MRILSIDQALSKSAYCCFEDLELVDYGIVEGIKSDEVSKVNHMAREIFRTMSKYNPNNIIIEDLPLGSVSNSVRSLAGLFYILHWGYPAIISYKPTTIKKNVLAGNALKSELFLSLPEGTKKKFIDYMCKDVTEKVHSTILSKLVDMSLIYKDFKGIEQKLRTKSNKDLTKEQILLKEEFKRIDKYFQTKVLYDLTDSYWIGQTFLKGAKC